MDRYLVNRHIGLVQALRLAWASLAANLGLIPLPIDLIAPADLRQPGDARPHLVPPELFRGIQGQIFHQQRARTNETHVATQHVP